MKFIKIFSPANLFRAFDGHHKLLLIDTLWLCKVKRAGVLCRQPPEQLVILPPPAPEPVAKATDRLKVARLQQHDTAYKVLVVIDGMQLRAC